MTTLKELLAARNLQKQYPEEARLAGTWQKAVDSHIPIVQPSTIPTTEKKKSLKELLAEKLSQNKNEYILNKEEVAAKLQSFVETPIEQIAKNYEAPAVQEALSSDTPSQAPTEYKGAFSLNIILNKEQLLAKELAFNGKSFCFIGAAGTGKTSTERAIVSALIEQNLLSSHTFKIQGTREYVVAPSIAVISFTRIAAGNSRKAIHMEPVLKQLLPHNITTIHNILEYTPEYYFDVEKNKETMRFLPKRHSGNPLDITHLIIEEASMVGLDLWEKVYDALRPGIQLIFVGDINQLPPVFGASILNYALTQLPVISLTEVYRQQEHSLILKNAHNILNGRTLEEGEDFRIIEGGNIQHHQSTMATMLGKQFPIWQDKDIYDPEQDIILSPWNKRELGTLNMNNWIAQHLGKKRGAIVYEILAGMNKLYLAVGDKVLYNKQVGEIVKISKNMSYRGKPPMKEGSDLTRFGVRIGTSSTDSKTFENEEDMFAGYEDIDLDKMLEKEDDTAGTASHLVNVLLETGEVHTLEAIGDFSSSTFSLGYCLTVHKAQGCEWRRVFLIMHRDHRVSLCRELFYTAITRARERVYCIAKKTTLEQAIKTQRIKGNTVEEKIQWFNSGLMEAGKTVNIVK